MSHTNSPYRPPNRNAGYSASKSGYDRPWGSPSTQLPNLSPQTALGRLPGASPMSMNAGMMASIPQPTPLILDNKKGVPKKVQEEKSSQKAIIAELATQSQSKVRKWFREQIEALDDDSDSD